MGRKKTWPPTIHHHVSGQDYFRFQGQNVYLGPTGSEGIRRHFLELVSQIDRTGEIETRDTNRPLTVVELVTRYVAAQTQERRRPDGEPTEEMQHIRIAFRPMLHRFATKPLADLTPSDMKAVRLLMIAGYTDAVGNEREGQCRETVNRNFARIKGGLSWGVEEGIMPGELYHRIDQIKNLRFGESGARESPPVKPIPEEDLEKALPRLTKIIRAMVVVQLHSHCRAGEIVRMCPVDIDRRPDKQGNWTWTLTEHKNAWRGHQRIIKLGPVARETITPYLLRAPALPCFSPKEAWLTRFGRPCAPWGNPGNDRYSVSTYNRAIRDVCERHKITPFSSGRLRHNAATRVAQKYGRETARRLLGHENDETIDIYADLEESERDELGEIIRKIG